MVGSVLRWMRRDLRSKIPGFLLALYVLTLLMILTQHTKTLQTLDLLSLRPFAQGSTVLPECRQFTRKERIKLDYLYYIQDLRKNKSLIWCKVPKAGSTTLARMFLRLADTSEPESSKEVHKMFKSLYPSVPADEVMMRRFNNAFKFLIVRHPFERILSAYRDKFQNYRRDREMRIYGDNMVKRPVENGTVVYPTFPEFVTYLLETNPNEYNRHWMLISQLCAPCNIHYDAIVKMENYSMEIKVPLEHVGIHEDIGWAHSTGTNKTIIEKYFSQLSLTQIQKLYHIYLEDFLLFDYTPNEYFAIVAQKTGTENCTVSTTVLPGA